MNDRRFSGRTICKRDVMIHVGASRYPGAIENMSNYGASIRTEVRNAFTKGAAIRLAIACDDDEELREALVMWAEAGALGAKFL